MKNLVVTAKHAGNIGTIPVLMMAGTENLVFIEHITIWVLRWMYYVIGQIFQQSNDQKNVVTGS